MRAHRVSSAVALIGLLLGDDTGVRLGEPFELPALGAAAGDGCVDSIDGRCWARGFMADSGDCVQGSAGRPVLGALQPAGDEGADASGGLALGRVVQAPAAGKQQLAGQVYGGE